MPWKVPFLMVAFKGLPLQKHLSTALLWVSPKSDSNVPKSHAMESATPKLLFAMVSQAFSLRMYVYTYI